MKKKTIHQSQFGTEHRVGAENCFGTESRFVIQHRFGTQCRFGKKSTILEHVGTFLS